MVDSYTLSASKFELSSDLAGEFPIYIYWPDDQSTLLYSKSVIELLNDTRVPKPLEIRNQGLSFLLQSGVVPPPETIYKGIYIVSIGDTAKVSILDGKIDVQFNHQFPFMNENRLSISDIHPDEELILKMIAEATDSRIDETKQSFLFHSAGKDSNSIALALAEAGWQDRYTLVTHKSKGSADESEISSRVAKRLGFRHRVLLEVDQLKEGHKKSVEDYFKEAPFPCVDNVTLAYPLYFYQLPELRNANLVFGDGNDSHMMSPPSKKQQFGLPYLRWTSKTSVFLRKAINSESKLGAFVRTPAELFGMSGFSYKESKRIFSASTSVYPYWSVESKLRKLWDILDFKSDIYSTRAITERMIRKLRNFADAIDSNVVLPFANEKIARYFSRMPEQHLFDRSTLSNKLILRKILKERMDLDSDQIGKKGWIYDSPSVVLNNWDWMYQEIQACDLWEQQNLQKISLRLRNRMMSKHRYAALSGKFVYRIYLLSSWYNGNKYINANT